MTVQLKTSVRIVLDICVDLNIERSEESLRRGTHYLKSRDSKAAKACRDLLPNAQSFLDDLRVKHGVKAECGDIPCSVTYEPVVVDGRLYGVFRCTDFYSAVSGMAT